MEDDGILKAELQRAVEECERLRQENADLRRQLGESATDAARSAQRLSSRNPERIEPSAEVSAHSHPDLKVSLFRRLFRGRDDVYAVRWEGRNGRTGYSPAGVREWSPRGAAVPARKKAVKHTQLFPLTDEVIRDHLLGKQIIGIYPLLHDDSCWFVAVDFDKKTWEADAAVFLATCNEVGVSAALERSRSGNGGHVWIFFAVPTPAALARRLASALLTRTMEQRLAVGLDSYDRVFPSQDTMPKGGFGNLIALPLQRSSREKGNSVFVNDQLRPYDDQWAFLSSIHRLSPAEVQKLIHGMFPSGDVVGVRRITVEDDDTGDPWSWRPSERPPIRETYEKLPACVSIELANMVFVEKTGLPASFLDHLIRLAAFQNPEFYSAQSMRLSTFGKPRVIACAEEFRDHIGLPRGLLEDILALFESNGVPAEVSDHRFGGIPIAADFHGETRAG